MLPKEKQVLYHITEASNLPKIRTEGLVPSIGKNSALSAEEEPYVYLCDYRSIPYWMLILRIQDPVLIRVHVETEETEEYVYSCYREFLAGKKVSPSKLSVLPIPKKVKDRLDDVNQELCLEYIYSLAHLCLDYARFYTGTRDIRKEDLAAESRTVLRVVRGLDYQTVPKEEIRNTIRESGNGGYAFTDHFCNTRRRLWSQLSHYGKDDLEKDRMELYRFMKETFGNYLYIETGGWDCDC